MAIKGRIYIWITTRSSRVKVIPEAGTSAWYWYNTKFSPLIYREIYTLRGENYALDPTLPSHWYITFCNWLKLFNPDLLNFIFIIFPSWMRLGLELNSKLNIFTTKQEIMINIIRPVYRLTSNFFKIIIKPSMWPNIMVQADQKKPSSRTKSNKEEK